MTLLAIDWSSIAVKIGQFILSFSILVTIHELGHFLTARWFKCRVEKFYLFFDPWFSIWKKKKGDTEYGIGWVPLGGYVKISGMIDESMDKEQMKLPPQPHEFRAKKAWQRLIIMVAGVIMNILLAIAIFIGITWKWGEESLPARNLSYGIYTDSLSRTIGLRDGDNIVSLDNRQVQDVGRMSSEIILKEVKTLTVQRGQDSFHIDVPKGFMKELVKKPNLMAFGEPRVPVIVDSVTKEATFTQGTLAKSDTLIGINGHPFRYSREFFDLQKNYKDSTVVLTALRGKDTVSAKWKLGTKFISMYFRSPAKIFGTVKKEYTFLQAIPVGVRRCFETLSRYMTSIRQLITHKVDAKDTMGGLISIGNTFPGYWDWEQFWVLTGVFSIILAFMNILPIPALDGGHAFFTLVELITGRKPSDKFMEYAQVVGMVLLAGLMVYALGLDVWRLFR